MTILADTFERRYQLQIARQARLRYTSQLIDRWDKTVRQALNQFATAMWSPKYILGLIPVASYRLRSQRVAPTAYVWRVERDIPPFDRYQCAAYRVQLSLDELGQPLMTVQSGDTTYTVSPLVVEALEATLAQAGYDAPLLIPRTMGRVED